VGIQFNWTVDLFSAFHRYSCDRKSDLLKYLLNVFTYLHGSRSGMGTPYLWLARALASLRPCILMFVSPFCVTRPAHTILPDFNRPNYSYRRWWGQTIKFHIIQFSHSPCALSTNATRRKQISRFNCRDKPILRPRKEVPRAVGKGALKASPFLPTAVFPSIPLAGL
jgi:hypothetical protein